MGDLFTTHRGPSVHMFADALHFSENIEMIMFCALEKKPTGHFITTSPPLTGNLEGI